MEGGDAGTCAACAGIADAHPAAFSPSLATDHAGGAGFGGPGVPTSFLGSAKPPTAFGDWPKVPEWEKALVDPNPKPPSMVPSNPFETKPIFQYDPNGEFDRRDHLIVHALNPLKQPEKIQRTEVMYQDEDILKTNLADKAYRCPPPGPTPSEVTAPPATGEPPGPHPSFTLAPPLASPYVHIRITETDRDIVDAGRPHTRLLWDAIFAPAPPLTKLEKVSGDMVPIGGEKPNYSPYCPSRGLAHIVDASVSTREGTHRGVGVRTWYSLKDPSEPLVKPGRLYSGAGANGPAPRVKPLAPSPDHKANIRRNTFGSPQGDFWFRFTHGPFFGFPTTTNPPEPNKLLPGYTKSPPPPPPPPADPSKPPPPPPPKMKDEHVPFKWPHMVGIGSIVDVFSIGRLGQDPADDATRLRHQKALAFL